MRIFYFIPALCWALLSACSSGDPQFPREETLTQGLMPLQGITDPVRVEVKHPFLILQNRTRADSLFHIYDLSDYELKSVFGTKGRGPDEFLLPWLFHTPFPDVLIRDSDDINKIYRFGIDREGQPVFKDVKQAGYMESITDAAFINDSLYVIDAKYMAPSLYLLSIRDRLPRKTRQFRNPGILDYYVDPDMANAYAGESRIALCYGWKKQIDFMDTGLNLIKRLKFKFDGPSVIENEGDVKAAYVYGYFGKRYFYTVFFGTSWKEHRASYRGTTLEVFDLDGNPVARYHLDGVSPGYFAVDEEAFTLYGAGDGGGLEDYLAVYKLKGLS
jgi:hypothetical protein